MRGLLMRAWGLTLGLLAVLAACAPLGRCAETAGSAAMDKTLIILNVDSAEPLDVTTKFQTQPASLVISFPPNRVVGSLPERSVVQRGVIQTLVTRYQSARNAQGKRYIESLHVGLRGAYPYRVRSESSRIVVEIDHPASVGGGTVEVGLSGGTIIGGVTPFTVSERFRAMEGALASAAGGWTGTGIIQEAPAAPAVSVAAPAAQPAAPARAPREPRPIAMLGITALIVLAAAGWWLTHQGGFAWSRGSEDASIWIPSAVVLVDQLVWRAFERDGYALASSREIGQPAGMLRIVEKDGVRWALMCVGNGRFFEKQTVDRYAAAMREAGVERGFLVASGAFTIPAQRAAKEQQVTLVGREELMELISAGAASEYVATQLADSAARLEEARRAVSQYEGELEAMRQQRNEARWHLGEERARAAKLEEQLAAFERQLQEHKAEIQRWETQTEELKSRWEQSQWYLGESRERAAHLEGQLGTLQGTVKDTEGSGRQLGELNGQLAEERAKRAGVEAQLLQLQRALDDSVNRELALQDAFDQIRRKLSALQTFGERRDATRGTPAEAFVEIRSTKKGIEEPLFAGVPKDVSRNGFRLEADQELPNSFRVLMRLPGLGRHIESRGRRMWQRPEGDPARFHGGYKLVGLSAETRDLIEQVVQKAQSQRS